MPEGIVNLAREQKSFREKKGERRKKVGKWSGWWGTTLLFPLLFSHCRREIASAVKAGIITALETFW
jgi:hypothetical protein